MDGLIKLLLSKFSEKELNSVSGDIVASSKLTFKKGDIYFIGFNPGGDESSEYSLKLAIENIYSEDNLYLIPYKPNQKTNKKTPLQNRYEYLFKNLNYDVNNVFSTNLIFRPSKNSKLVNFEKEAEKCWKAHEVLLDVVQPKVIICNGNGSISSFSYIKKFIKNISNTEEVFAGHGNWKIRSLQGEIKGRNIYVIGIPHMSYYHPKNGIVYLNSLINTI